MRNSNVIYTDALPRLSSHVTHFIDFFFLPPAFLHPDVGWSHPTGKVLWRKPKMCGAFFSVLLHFRFFMVMRMWCDRIALIGKTMRKMSKHAGNMYNNKFTCFLLSFYQWMVPIIQSSMKPLEVRRTEWQWNVYSFKCKVLLCVSC